MNQVGLEIVAVIYLAVVLVLGLVALLRAEPASIVDVLQAVSQLLGGFGRFPGQAQLHQPARRAVAGPAVRPHARRERVRARRRGATAP